MGNANLSVDASSGQKLAYVDNVTDFGFDGLNKEFAHVLIMDDDTTGRPIEGGIEGAELIEIDSVDIPTNLITFKTNLENSWTTAKNTTIVRAPGGIPVKTVRMGDVRVVKQFPAVTVIPRNKNIEWVLMPGGTKETMNIDFMVYTRSQGGETTIEDNIKLTDVVEWILMSNLHIHPYEHTDPNEVTSKAGVGSIEYGVIQKGSEFINSARVSWSGDIYYIREYLFRQHDYMPRGF